MISEESSVQQQLEAKAATLDNAAAGRTIARRAFVSPDTAQLKTLDWPTALKKFEANFPYPAYYLKGYHGVGLHESGYLSQLGAMTWDAVVRETFAYLQVPGFTQAQTTQKVLEDAYKLLQKNPINLLDLGTGTGHAAFAFAERYPDAAITGIDLAGPMLAVADYRAEHAALTDRVTFLQRSAHQTGLPAAAFDLITAWILFHELPADFTRLVLQEAYRVCQPGGAIIVYDAFGRTVPRYIPFPEPYLREFHHLDFKQELENAGFQEIVYRDLPGGQWYALAHKRA